MPDPRSAPALVTTGAVELAAGLRCEENSISGLVLVSAWPDTADKVFGTVGKALKIGIPDDCRTTAGSDHATAFRIAPRRLMIVSQTPDLFSSLKGAVPCEDGSVSQQDHSRIRIRLTGPGAAALLSRGAPVDFDRSVFPAGTFAQTGIHHMWVLIHKIAEEPEAYDLYVLRSFALSFWQWLQESAHIATQTPMGREALAG
ncbi:sarcosine oxidase subunit gamma [Hoeflea sp. TYP-13]|uniref:sarcosine oxidase subunit gamma n=1 Tax=Hoeflea sp. TYP-13 TaxID=3230023 RepID=UPI0034C5B5B6